MLKYYSDGGTKTAVVDDSIAFNPADVGMVEVALAVYQADVHALAHANVASLIAVGIGEIKTFASSTVPAGYLLCDGSAFLTNDWPLLHAYLQAAGLAPNTTPDLRDRFVVATGPGHPVNTTGGSATDVSSAPSGPNTIGITLLGAGSAASATHTHTVDTEPPYYALVYAIRAQ